MNTCNMNEILNKICVLIIVNEVFKFKVFKLSQINIEIASYQKYYVVSIVML